MSAVALQDNCFDLPMVNLCLHSLCLILENDWGYTSITFLDVPADDNFLGERI